MVLCISQEVINPEAKGALRLLLSSYLWGQCLLDCISSPTHLTMSIAHNLWEKVKSWDWECNKTLAVIASGISRGRNNTFELASYFHVCSSLIKLHPWILNVDSATTKQHQHEASMTSDMKSDMKCEKLLPWLWKSKTAIKDQVGSKAMFQADGFRYH